jgi:hypothetical protein
MEGRKRRVVEFDSLVLIIQADDIIFSSFLSAWKYPEGMKDGSGIYRCIKSNLLAKVVEITGMFTLQHYVYQDHEYSWHIFARSASIGEP